jgi:hypothetical protein
LPQPKVGLVVLEVSVLDVGRVVPGNRCTGRVVTGGRRWPGVTLGLVVAGGLLGSVVSDGFERRAFDTEGGSGMVVARGPSDGGTDALASGSTFPTTGRATGGIHGTPARLRKPATT